MPSAALQDLWKNCLEQIGDCAPLFGKRLVPGEGCWDRPPLMLIGEAPGQQEEEQGRPFVGKAGKNLSDFLAVVGLERDALYISNVVKIRPTSVSKAGRTVNRTPSKEELRLFTPWLYQEIALVRPRALVTLGNTALHSFVAPEMMIGDCHGEWQWIHISTHNKMDADYPLFPLYHPASVIYNRSLTDVYQRDVRTLAASYATIG